jgi:prepilin-type N-terminal cleavage/methylation domain-containing protein
MAGTRTGERGMSLIEALITLVLLGMAMAIFYEMMLSSLRAGMFSESRNDLATIGQRAANAIHTEVIQAKLIFQENAVGTAYRTRIAAGLPAGVAAIAGSRMPIIDQNTTIIGQDPGPDNIATRTGNSMIVVRQLSPLAVPWDNDNNVATPNVSFFVDRYQFEYYFLKSDPRTNFGGLGYYLDVMQGTSQVFADYFQINSIAVNKAQVAANARTAGNILMAWDPGKAITDPAFYDMSAAGVFTGNTTPVFAMTVKSLAPEISGGRVSGRMSYSVAPNPTATIKFKDPVPRYATGTANFPQGLEFQIVGGSGSRKILTRLVLASNYAGSSNSQESIITSSARGF